MEKYQRLELLGQGTYGMVYKAKNIKTGKIVALKKAVVHGGAEGIPSTTLREVSLLKSLDSPYIVKLLEVTYDISDLERPVLLIAFEYLDYDLKQYMRSEYGRGVGIDPALARRFCYQLLSGLHHCHAQGVMHRDLKPANLLIDVGSGVLKVADFGLGRAFELPQPHYTHEVVTQWYRAPEVLLGTRRYSTAIDVWSAGCIFGEMLLGAPMFKGENELEQILDVFHIRGTPNPQTWPGVDMLRDWHTYPTWEARPLSDAIGWKTKPSQEALDLMEGMLQLDPSKRMTAREAMNSAFFAGICVGNSVPISRAATSVSSADPEKKEEKNLIDTY